MNRRMKRNISILTAAVFLIFAVPDLECMASQSVWSPLLPLKSAEADALSDAFESDLDSMKSEWRNARKETAEGSESLSKRTENASLEAQASALESRIDDLRAEISDAEAGIVKARALLSVGSVTKSELETLENEKTSLEQELKTAENDLKKAQTDRSAMEGYRENDDGWDSYGPDLYTDFWNGALDELTDYALSHDADYCEAATLEQEALWTLWMDYTVRQAKGQEIPDEIFDYILNIASGDKIEEDDLEASYNEYLAALEEQEAAVRQAEADAAAATAPVDEAEPDSESGYGPGYETDDFSDDTDEASEDTVSADEDTEEISEEGGSQDDFCDEILSYQDKALARINLEETLIQNIEIAYDDLGTAWSNYVSLTEKSESAEDVLKLNRVRYRVGDRTKSEYEAVIDEYASLDSYITDAEYTYRNCLYELDTLTSGGLSYICDNPGQTAPDPADTSRVSIVAYLRSDPLTGEFTLGIEVPRNMQREITHFELWRGDTMIGGRTGTDGLLRSPTLTADQLSDLRLWFLRDGEYVGDCEFDPYVPIGQVTADIRLR